MPPQHPRVPGLCPPEADLVCATSGELPPEEWAAVRQHLADCEKCRSKLREILDTLATCAQLPDLEPLEPVNAGREQLKDFMAAARADREAMSPRRWLAAAAMLFLVFALIALFRADRVDADEVVRRAADRELSITLPAGLWRWRFIPGEGDATQPAQAAVPPRAVETLQALGVDLEQPLSVARLQAWRASHPDRREYLTQRDHLYVVTSKTQGPVREVELVIEKSTYQLVKQTWLIAGLGRVVCERITLDQSRVGASR